MCIGKYWTVISTIKVLKYQLVKDNFLSEILNTYELMFCCLIWLIFSHLELHKKEIYCNVLYYCK